MFQRMVAIRAELKLWRESNVWDYKSKFCGTKNISMKVVRQLYVGVCVYHHTLRFAQTNLVNANTIKSLAHYYYYFYQESLSRSHRTDCTEMHCRLLVFFLFYDYPHL